LRVLAHELVELEVLKKMHPEEKPPGDKPSG